MDVCWPSWETEIAYPLWMDGWIMITDILWQHYLGKKYPEIISPGVLVHCVYWQIQWRKQIPDKLRKETFNISSALYKPLKSMSVVQFGSFNGAGLMGIFFSICRDLVLSLDDVRSLSLKIDSDQGRGKGRQRATRNLKPRENRVWISHGSMKRWSLTQAGGLQGKL